MIIGGGKKSIATGSPDGMKNGQRLGGNISSNNSTSKSINLKNRRLRSQENQNKELGAIKPPNTQETLKSA